VFGMFFSSLLLLASLDLAVFPVAEASIGLVLYCIRYFKYETV
jgi:hypothetical protein